MLLSALVSSALFLAPALPQNEIVLVDGKVIEVKTIKTETYSEVTYKTVNGGDGRKDAHLVREVIHDTGSASLDDYVAAVAMMDAGDFRGAMQNFLLVLEDRAASTGRNSWTIQHAWFRIMECGFADANYSAVTEAADKLLEQVPDTFFYGPALMMKADAQAARGDAAGAEETYRALASAVATKGLPERWNRESELGLVLLDKGLRGAAKRSKLEQIEARNSREYPTVASRANVEIGNSYLDEGDLDKAKGFFEGILNGGSADDHTEAYAWFGLGEVAYQQGLASDDAKKSKELFFQAGLDFLRVALMYPQVIELVPDSLGKGAVAFYRIGDTESQIKALRLKNRLAQRFPDSPQLKRAEEEMRR
jgi:tetratricopeptide (TPR) repeat protein